MHLTNISVAHISKLPPIVKDRHMTQSKKNKTSDSTKGQASDTTKTETPKKTY